MATTIATCRSNKPLSAGIFSTDPLADLIFSYAIVARCSLNLPNFFAELQRRHVYKVGAAYAVAGWLVVQIVTQVFPIFEVSALAQRIIVLVIVAGFPITIILTWLFDITPKGIVRTDDLPATGENHAMQRERVGMDRKMNYVLALLLVTAIGYFVLDRTVLRRGSEQATSNAKSIAVLPLVNTSGDAANDYFSDGLSEELIAVLAKIPGLKIIGRSSSFLFKGKSDDSRTIGEKLGVTNLLEGSVRKQGDRVRIVAELINAADGRALWSETYDRELKDVFAVQSEIATAVTDQLKIKLLGAPAKSDAAPSNDNLAAYNALQQGTFYFRLSTEEGTRKATEFYGEAIRLDPRYALAYAQLSAAWRQLAATWLGGAEANEAYAKARNAAQTALSLAPDLAAAHEALGWVLMTPDLDFAAAEAEFRKAEELAPADAGPKFALSFVFAVQGRLEEAENIMRQTLALDPLGVTRYLNLARILIAGGRYDEADAALRKAIALQPAAARLHAYLTTLDVLRGNAAAALQDAQLEPKGFWRDYALALALQIQNDRGTADAALQKLTDENAVSGPFQIATVYALRKEPDKMFEWLEHAYTEHDPGLTQLLGTPFILNYKDDLRFGAICRKLKVQVPATAVAKP
jgi:TolB-like protein/Flp pilus assembly protein TadD